MTAYGFATLASISINMHSMSPVRKFGRFSLSVGSPPMRRYGSAYSMSDTESCSPTMMGGTFHLPAPKIRPDHSLYESPRSSATPIPYSIVTTP
jgi:hypothetical protein